MLRNQTFYPPLEVAVGQELFEESNVYGFNLVIARLFQELSRSIIGLRFSFLGKTDSDTGNPVLLFNRLSSMGISFGFSFFWDSKSPIEVVRDTLSFFDVVYMPILSVPYLPIKGLNVLDRGIFLNSLEVLRISIVAPSVEVFRS